MRTRIEKYGEEAYNYRHGGCLEHKLEYNSWRAMKNRCYDKNYRYYHRYGGRGIKVCDQWLGRYGFEMFLKDMGKKPSPKHSIDRINNDGDYSPENCRWATQKEQIDNSTNVRLISIDGVVKNYSEWCREFNILPSVASNRESSFGWDEIKAITTPKQKRVYKTIPRNPCKVCGKPVHMTFHVYCSNACYLKQRWGYVAV